MPDGVTTDALPPGWVTVTFDNLVARGEYGTSVKCNYQSGGTPVLRIPNIAAGRIVLDDLKFATESVGYDEADYLQPGDLLVCRTNGSISLSDCPISGFKRWSDIGIRPQSVWVRVG